MKLNKHINNNTISFTSNRILYGYHEFRFGNGNVNRRYYVNNDEVAHEIFFRINYYNI
jgi:hypothetical protein